MPRRRFHFPTQLDVQRQLRSLKPYVETDGAEVLLQVVPEDGTWGVHLGAGCRDADGRGLWGAGFLAPTTSCRDLARQLLNEVADAHHDAVVAMAQACGCQ